MGETENMILGALPGGRGDEIASSLAELVNKLLAPENAGFSGSVETIATQLDQIRLLSQEQTAALADNTQAVVQNTAVQATGGKLPAAGDVARSAARTILSGFTLAPLISGLAGLFRGSKTESPAPLVKYGLPPSVEFQGGLIPQSTPGIAGVDYGDDGRPRAIPRAAPYGGPPVTIQVQAMDSRSFLDHSDEIARAVREALLNAHSLGDVMSELQS